MKKTKLMLGDNIESLKKLPDNSIDSVVTDPPYGLSFMNKKWDYEVPKIEFWIEVYRVLKPGGHVLSFGGTRTYHRMVVNIEDAGFEIRDQIQWIYGSGFPKSLNVGKAVDKLEGNDREDLGKNPAARPCSDAGDYETNTKWKTPPRPNISKGTSPYEGWGTNLKPANEPICLARKPLSEKSIAENVLKWGTGGINIDGCRVGFNGDIPNEVSCLRSKENLTGWAAQGTLADRTEPYIPNSEGRFPANIILECICDEVIRGEKGEKTTVETNINNKDANWWFRNTVRDKEQRWSFNDKGDIHTNPMCPCRLLDRQSGTSKSSIHARPLAPITEWFGKRPRRGPGTFAGGALERGSDKNTDKITGTAYNDKGGASRFFYQAKASKKERNMGLDYLVEGKEVIRQVLVGEDNNPIHKNNHPTLKPINLMTYLCRLVTPVGGIVLDPFMGSGSTGISAQLEGFRFVGMEMDKDYFKIAEARINSYEEYRKLIK